MYAVQGVSLRKVTVYAAVKTNEYGNFSPLVLTNFRGHYFLHEWTSTH